MTRKYFGTDGVRGEVGQEPITPDFVLRLAYAAGRVLVNHDQQTPTVLIGKDTRISGYMLEAALQAGFTAAGVNVLLTGPLPTPGIFLVRPLCCLCWCSLFRILGEASTQRPKLCVADSDSRCQKSLTQQITGRFV